eukprot:4082461-Pyramimonas_sp.AAC.1
MQATRLPRCAHRCVHGGIPLCPLPGASWSGGASYLREGWNRGGVQFRHHYDQNICPARLRSTGGPQGDHVRCLH